MLADIVTSVPTGRLNNQKMMTLNDIVHSPLFQRPACRAILLPVVVRRVKEFLSGPQEVSLSFAKFCFCMSHNVDRWKYEFCSRYLNDKIIKSNECRLK